MRSHYSSALARLLVVSVLGSPLVQPGAGPDLSSDLR
jgi:hypothetical protein